MSESKELSEFVKEIRVSKKYLKRGIFKTATEVQIHRQWDVPFKEGWNEAVKKQDKKIKQALKKRKLIL